jgi:hypothetical protein
VKIREPKRGRPRVTRLPVGQTKTIRTLIREQLKERRLKRSDFDELLGRPARYTDNGLNQRRQMAADVAIAILDEIWTRYRVPAAGALLDGVCRRVRGADLSLPMIMPADTVAPLVAAFERYAVAKGENAREASVWGTLLRYFIEETRLANAGALHLDLIRQVRDALWTISDQVINPADFDRALRLTLHLTGNTRAVFPNTPAAAQNPKTVKKG